MATLGIKFFQHHQTTPSDTWIIAHNFGSKPMVDINVDLGGGVVDKAFPLAVYHTDDNNVTILWTSPRTGWVTFASPSDV